MTKTGSALAVIIAGLCLAGCQAKAPATDTRDTHREAGLVDGAFAPSQLAASASPRDLSARETLRQIEARDIAARPDIASRGNNVLTISFDDAPVARFTDRVAADCMSADCIAWSFRGTAMLTSRKGKRELYALILQDGADGWGHFTFIGPEHGPERGLTWFSNWPSVSPDGRYIAEGSREGQDVAGFLNIVDWATHYPHPVVRFDASCNLIGWQGAAQLRVRCDYPGNDGTARATVATVSRDADGGWTLTETAEVTGDADTPVTQSTLQLRTLKARTAPAAATVDSVMLSPKTATEAQLRAEGMEWLVTPGP